MPEPKVMGNAKTDRFHVRIPVEDIDELNGYIKESGMHQAHFLSNALVVGARQIALQQRAFLTAR